MSNTSMLECCSTWKLGAYLPRNRVLQQLIRGAVAWVITLVGTPLVTFGAFVKYQWFLDWNNWENTAV